MASIHKDILIDAPADDVWDAVRDFGALHQRLVPGFVLDTKLDGDARIVTFSNGTVARELLVDCDDARQRLVYAVISERLKQHSASVQVIADGEAAAAWSGSSTCCRTRSRPISTRRWIRPRSRSRSRIQDARPHERLGISRRTRRATAPAARSRAAGWICYGRFVGSWDLDVTQFPGDGSARRRKGEWHFGWVLEGRATRTSGSFHSAAKAQWRCDGERRFVARRCGCTTPASMDGRCSGGIRSRGFSADDRSRGRRGHRAARNPGGWSAGAVDAFRRSPKTRFCGAAKTPPMAASVGG